MPNVTLVPWAPEHLPLLIAADAPEMTRYIGGPEGEEAVRRRHDRYLRSRADRSAWMYAIEADGEPTGGIGFWPVEHDGEPAYETGWNVLPRWQGHGVARQALLALIRLLDEQAPPRARLYAYPSVENAASNALCRTTGFAALGERDFPFRGTVLRTRVWALDLPATTPVSGADLPRSAR